MASYCFCYWLLFKKMVFVRLASSLFVFSFEISVYLYIPRYFILETYNAFLLLVKNFF